MITTHVLAFFVTHVKLLYFGAPANADEARSGAVPTRAAATAIFAISERDRG